MSKETKGLRQPESDPEKNKHKKSGRSTTGRINRDRVINRTGNTDHKKTGLDSSKTRTGQFDHPTRSSGERGGIRETDVPSRKSEIKSLTGKLDKPMKSAFHRVDYNRVETIKSTFQSSKNELLHIQIETKISFELSRRMGKNFLASRDAYESLLDEIKRSGIASELSENQEELRQVILPSLLPKEDSEWVSPAKIAEMIKTMRKSKPLGEDLGQSELAKLTDDVITKALERELNRPTNRPPRLRAWLMNWKEVILGAGLAATNLALGGVAILANPTFGQVDLPSALAIAGSVYLGLSDAKNSLHKVNADIEGEEDKLE